ncbi:hypothetical protein FA95DRAFT_1551753 [Auriscalpium vulgare]|uniref:Uncharacterized protein n=1 Tax=Auriscalpium vulgare TaxID=40419 RepID=A0ACB8SCN7_9AGAM|nr:hypothetical protein FA95DRAFT_1551753 [Auriscalpium vulgare]
MAPGSPSARSAHSLIFGSGEQDTPTPRVATDLEEPAEDLIQPDAKGRPQSMYVTLFEDMLTAVLQHEQHLLHDEEIKFFCRLEKLKYEAKYLLIRLCLRKSGKWLRFSSLKYQSEIGATLEEALQALSANSNPEVKQEEPEVVDLTFDDDDEYSSVAPPRHPVKKEEISEPQAGPSSMKLEDHALADQCGDLSFFVHDHVHASMPELLGCLRTDELKSLARDMKVNTTGPRQVLIDALMRTSSSQTTLPFRDVQVKGKKKKLLQTTLPFSQKPPSRLREMVMKILGGCVRVNKDVVMLLRRINLIYLRATQHTTDLLTPSILSYARKRSYAQYDYVRTKHVWPSRAALMAYERALEREMLAEELIEGSSSSTTRGRSRSLASHTPAARGSTRSVSPKKESHVVEEVPPRIQSATALRTLLDDGLYNEWKDLMKSKSDHMACEIGLERFEAGHILTRIIHKCADALGTLKEYDRELVLLNELLAQRHWRRGRRGAWYDRRALILMHHLAKLDLSGETRHRAMLGVVEALEDPDTRLVYRQKLERRLTRLEKLLNIPPEERHVCEGNRQSAKQVNIYRERVRGSLAGLHLDSMGRKIGPDTKDISNYLERKPKAEGGEAPQRALTVSVPEQKGKSTWKGRDGIVVNVEMVALQHYEEDGYKGYHCEGSIVTTLFGLLFWDIIFAPVAGAFETPYQSAPLDLCEDSFYLARQQLFEQRLEEITNGKARDLVKTVDDLHREKGTWCVGVRWDKFPRQHLLDIVDCFLGKSLASICRVLCESYAGHCSGLPDLFLWNHKTRHCKFVEVKGPGDRLQENQKVWIEFLQRAEVDVEVCHVDEAGNEKKQAPPRKRGRRARGKAKKGKDTDEEMEGPESEEEGDMPVNQSDVENDRTLVAEPSSSSSQRKRLAEDLEEPATPLSPKRLRSAATAATSLRNVISSQRR